MSFACFLVIDLRSGITRELRDWLIIKLDRIDTRVVVCRRLKNYVSRKPYFLKIL